MMTFEEFFLKKKIDLKSLADAKPDLFQEFKTHYAQMGEKSFDHTKKYWFNPLRKDFKLSDEDELELKEALHLVKKEIIEVPSQNLDSETVTSTVQGFKPRFKAGATPTSSIKQDEKVAETPLLDEKSKEEAPKSIGFKPRFKAGATQIKKSED